jgi:hypothetical protein
MAKARTVKEVQLLQLQGVKVSPRAKLLLLTMPRHMRRVLLRVGTG